MPFASTPNTDQDAPLDQEAFSPEAHAQQAHHAVRRRGSVKQGFALETLGHAVEYLVDSRLFARNEDDARTDQEAIQLLMRLSRAVFAECPEVVPFRRRFSQWMVNGLRRTSPAQASSPRG